MTEKRFTSDVFDDGLFRIEKITDNADGVCYKETDDVVDLLNEQHEEIQSLTIENDELKREVTLLTEFFRKKNFVLDDFNEWLTKERWGWEEKEVCERYLIGKWSNE